MSRFQTGQWIGETTSNKGDKTLAVLNIERRNPSNAQILSTSLVNPLLRTCADATIKTNDNQLEGEVTNHRFHDTSSGKLISAEEFWRIHSIEGPIPKLITYKAIRTNELLEGTYNDDVGNSGTFNLQNTREKPASNPDFTLPWNEFKAFVSNTCQEHGKLAFRGQHSSNLKLRSLFHRCERSDLVSFINNDVPELRRQINAISSHYYSSENPDDLGALLSLAQHHGYPTPLLDWTESPYVAAFFALESNRVHESGTESVRVFIFDTKNWINDVDCRVHLTDPLPNLSFHRLPARNNPRYMPQQSIAAMTSVDDVEWFIHWMENRPNTPKYLTIVDIPITERQVALADLRVMGITYSTLFPGIEGICRSLRSRYFD